MPRMFLLSAALLLTLAAPVAGQVSFSASADRQQVVPPVPTHFLFFTCEFDIVTGPGQISVVRYNGSSLAPLQKAEIFKGKPGVASSRVLHTLTLDAKGNPVGTTRQLAFRELTDLKSGCYYVQAMTAGANPVVMRGQILPDETRFGAQLDGQGAKPPTPSTVRGLAEFDLNYPTGVTYYLSYQLPSAQDVLLRDRNNPLTQTKLQGTQGTINNFFWVDKIADGTAEVVVTSQAFPQGEIGGCVVPSASSYGQACAHNSGTMTLSMTGAPTSRGDITIRVSGGIPNDDVNLFISSNKASFNMFNCRIYIDASVLLAIISMKLDAQGNGSFTIGNLPRITVQQTVYLQAVGQRDVGPPLYVTNGLKVVLGSCP